MELVGVMVVLGAIAASAIPAASAVGAFQAETVYAETRSYLTFARQTAAATGLPTGVRMNTSTQLMDYVQILTPGAPPTPMLDHNGLAREPVLIDRHGGACFQSITGTGEGGASRTVWFGHAGTPQQRETNGAYSQDAPGAIVITFTTGGTVVVQAHTGLVE
jgi:Tfp pilus assembly protein FimT